MINICAILGKWLKGEEIDISLVDGTYLTNQTLAQAQKNRLALLLNRAFNNRFDENEIIKAELNKVNSHNIRLVYLVKKVHNALEAENIKHYFYKGPIQQKVLYGDYFAKPSLDVDFIVDYKDFERAGEILAAAGFTLGAGCEKIWWKYFLGEQHYFIKEMLPLSVDLHHRMQQPGGPAPKHIDRMLASNMKVDLGSGTVDSFSLPMIAIIASINLLKAIYHHSPIGSHAFDLIVALYKMSKEEIQFLREEAKIQSLYNSIKFCSRVTSKLFEVEDLFSNEKYKLPYSEENLYPVLIDANYTNNNHPKRREFLFELCDNKYIDTPKEFLRWALSEFSQSLT